VLYGKTREQIEEIIRVCEEGKFDYNTKWPRKLNNMFQIEFNRNLIRWQKALDALDRPLKVHRIEIPFIEVEYFVNEKDCIEAKFIEKEKDNAEYLYCQRMELSKKYRKSKAAIVDFLNKQISECKKENELYKNPHFKIEQED
jgi:hypothetical protein